MSSIETLAAGYAAFALVLGVYVVWRLQAPAADQYGGPLSKVVLLVVCYVLAFVVCIGLYGRAIPSMLLRVMPSGDVVAAHLIDGERIYVLIEDGSSEPLLVSLPWSESTAGQLVAAMQEASETGVTVEVNGKASGLDPRDPMFYTAPVAPLPPKVTND